MYEIKFNNSITDNQEFVNTLNPKFRKIVSKVPQNQQHSRFVIQDHFVNVESNNQKIALRTVVLTDKIYPLFKTVSKNSEKLVNKNNNLQVVPSCLLGPSSKGGTDKKQGKKEEAVNIRIGFDSEWVERDGKRFMLSYQLSVYLNDDVLYEWIIFAAGHRLSSYKMISLFLQDLSELGVRIGPCDKESNGKKVICYLSAHYSIIDLSTFYDVKSLLKQTDTVRRSQTTALQPISIRVRDKNRNYYQDWLIVLRDTMHLAPQGSSLEKLANAMGKIKLLLPNAYDKNDMSKLLKEQEDEYMLYSTNDATLTLDYLKVMYPDDTAIPVTLGSEGASIFRQKIMDLNNWSKEEFNYQFRGLDTIKADRKSVLTARKEAVQVLEVASHAYFGGRNECYMHGICKDDKGWFDFDLSGAYPSAMALLQNPDFSKISVLTGDIFKISPLDYTFGLVDFEFPQDVKYPCLPIKDREGRGLIFVKSGRTYASAPEIYLALQMGAKIKWVQGGIQAGTTGRYDMKTALTDLLIRRAEAKQIYGKGSVQEVKMKELINSVYGKMAQGLEKKRSYSTRSDSVKDMPLSNITQPLIAAMITSIVRATVTSAMQQLNDLGFKVASVTTDGFLCNANLDTLKSLDLYGFRDALSKTRLDIVGDDTIWELKHSAKTLIMIATRGGFGIGRIGENKLPTAKAGYKPEQGFYELYADNSNNELSKRFLGRKGRLDMAFNKLPSPKEYVRSSADGVGKKEQKNIEWEFDLKRKPVDIKEEEIIIDNEQFKHVTYNTTPWHNMTEFNDARAVKKGHPELYPMKSSNAVFTLDSMIKDKQSARNSGMIIQNNNKGGIYRTAVISYLRAIASGKEAMPAWMANLNYRQRAEECNLRLKDLNIVLTINDFKKAALRQKVTLENSEAVSVIKNLLK